MQLRSERLIASGEWVVPDLRHLLDARGWTSQAACVDEIALFGSEGQPVFKERLPASATELLKMLFCAGCSVREQCLTDSLTPYAIPAQIWERGDMMDMVSPPMVLKASGTWGGADAADRRTVKDLPRDEAVKTLESNFDARLQERVTAWRSAVAQPGHRFSRNDRRVAAWLGEELPTRSEAPVRRFDLGPGPGRGHRGPIAIYAAAHHVSRSTAWRRLRAQRSATETVQSWTRRAG